MNNNKKSMAERCIRDLKEADNFLKKILVSGVFIGKVSMIFGFSLALVFGMANIVANTTSDIKNSIIILGFLFSGFIFEQFCSLILKLLNRKKVKNEN